MRVILRIIERESGMSFGKRGEFVEWKIEGLK